MHLHEGDVCDLPAIRRVVMDLRPDHVAHLAAIAFVAHADVEQMYSVNIAGTRQLLQALSELPTPVASVLIVSSANVYGNSREGVLDENTPPAPVNDYGVSKLAMEHVASTYGSKLPLIIARPFNYTGKGQSSDFVIPKIVQHFRERAPVLELGNLEVARDFSDVRTVADAYVKLLATPGAIGEVFNVCSGRSITLQNVLDTISQLSGHQLAVEVNSAFVRANEVRTLLGSRDKIERVIGPLRLIPFEETLRWMLQD